MHSSNLIGKDLSNSSFSETYRDPNHLPAIRQTKIIVRIFGGIGNQLFCYAAARRLALKNNAELVIDCTSGFVRDHTYNRKYQLGNFNIQSRQATATELFEPFSRLRRFFKREWNKRLPFEQRSYIFQVDIDFDPRLLYIKPKGTVCLEGYWQSENYFKDVADILHLDLKIKPPADHENKVMASKIHNCMAVAVHVRFFDEPQEPNFNNAPNDYYNRAIEKMEELISGAHYFIFSDKPELARARIPLPDSRVTLVSHNLGDEYAYADLWLMTQCKHFIIANSTFSWWGAWLATNAFKKIIAPGFEMRQGKMWWGFKGLLPDEWIKL